MKANPMTRVAIYLLLLFLFPARLSCQELTFVSDSIVIIKKQKLDSIVSFEVRGPFNKVVPDDKDTYVYNAAGQLINECNYDWSRDGKRWYLRTEMICNVDTSRNVTTKTEWSWQYLSDKIQNGSKTENFFDAWGKGYLAANYEWDILTGAWIGKWKSRTYKDKLGRDSVNMYYEWSRDDQDWREVTRHSYSYDTTGCMNAISREDLDRNTGRMEHTGSDDNLCKKLHVPASDVGYCRDEASGKMFPCRYKECAYDSNGDVILAKIFTKSHLEKKWKCTEKRLYSYDSNRNMIKKITKSGSIIHLGYKSIENFDFDKDVPVGVLIVPPDYRDLLLGFIINNPIPYENCNNRINGYSNTDFFITRYRTKGVFYYSNF
jgi:hypothetical protein